MTEAQPEATSGNDTSFDKKPVASIAVFLRGGRPGVEEREVLDEIGPREPLRFRYLAFGLSRCLAEEYLERPQPLAAALASLMRSRLWDRKRTRRPAKWW